MNRVECRLCGGQAQVVRTGLPGYVVGSSFDVCCCSACDVSFVVPCRVDRVVYEMIYKDAAGVPGYAQYFAQAEEVLRAPAPLDYLMATSSVYWAVGTTLRRMRRERNGRLRVLEVGSGLGYLTYSLSCEGFDVRGLDVSASAVNAARARYGDLFVNADVEAFAKDGGASFDAVVLTEVVEHVEDVVGLLSGVMKLVAPGGVALITTPNKRLFAGRFDWNTELPPVHLWWLSERSFEVLAGLLECAVRFVDFSEYNKLNYRTYSLTAPACETRPVFSSDGQLLVDRQRPPARVRPLVSLVRRLGLEPVARLVRDVSAGRRRHVGEMSDSLCAVLERRR